MAITSVNKKTSLGIYGTWKNAINWRERPEATITIFGGLHGVLVILFASILHYIKEPFTFASHWVSNMGIGPNGSALMFNYGLIGSAIFMGTSILTLTYKMWIFKIKGVRTLIAIGTIAGLTAVTGIFMLTLNPMNGDIGLHATGAYMYFVCSITYFVLATIAMRCAKIQSRKHTIMTIILLILNLLNIPIQYCTIRFVLYPELPASELGFSHFMSILGSMDPRLGLVRIFEWIILVGFFVWVIGTGLMLAKIPTERYPFKIRNYYTHPL